jgi:hypothetical protein
MYRRAVSKVYSLLQRRPAGPTMLGLGIFSIMSAKLFTGNGWAGHSHEELCFLGIKETLPPNLLYNISPSYDELYASR